MRHTAGFSNFIRSTHNERGAALVISLLTMTLLSLLGGAAITTSQIEQMISGNVRTSGKAKALAAAGIERGRVTLRTNFLDNVLDGRHAWGIVNASYYGKLALSGCTAPTPGTDGSCTFGGGTYSVIVKNNIADDTGGSATDDVDDIVIIRSTGVDTTSGATATIETTVKKDPNFTPTVSGALSLVGDAQRSIACQAGACRFDGRDWVASDVANYQTGRAAWLNTYNAGRFGCMFPTLDPACFAALETAANTAAVAATGDVSWDDPTGTEGHTNKWGIGISDLEDGGQTGTQAELDTRVNQTKHDICQSGSQATPNCNVVRANNARGKGFDAYAENTGDRGDASVGSDIPLDKAEVRSFVDLARGVAESTLDTNNGLTCSGGSCTVNASDLTGLQAEAITYIHVDQADTDVELVGLGQTVIGSGLLILDGVSESQLTISGTLNWDGMIIVTGHNVGFNVNGTGRVSVTGGIVVADEDTNGTLNGNSINEFSVSGALGSWNTVDILYSSQSIQAVQDAVSAKGAGRVITMLNKICDGLDASGNCI